MTRSGRNQSPGVRWLAIVLGATGVAAYLVSLVAYLVFPGFLEHVEPALASIAAAFLHGDFPIYPPDVALAPHAPAYGPVFFMISAAWIGITEDAIFGAKLASSLAVGTGLAMMGWAFFRGTRRWDLALFLTGLAAWWLLRMGMTVFLARPASQILMISALSLWTITLRSDRVAVILLGLLMGIMAGIKINAALAILPLAGLLWHRSGFKAFMTTGLIAAAVTLAPFLIPNVFLGRYVACLGIAARHGLSGALFLKVTWLILILLLPLACCGMTALWMRREAMVRELKEHWAFWLPLLPVILVQMVFASKAGSGASQLVVLVPVLGGALIRIASVLGVTVAKEAGSGGENAERPATEPKFSGAEWTAAKLLLMALYFGPIAIQTVRIHSHSPWSLYLNPEVTLAHRLVRSEVLDFLKTNPSVRVGIGFGESPRSQLVSSFRAELVRRGHPYLIEPVFLMDTQAAGIEVNPEQALSPEAVDVWLLPKEPAPFRAINYYTARPILPEEFVRRFASDWQLRNRTQLFDLWVPKHPASP